MQTSKISLMSFRSQGDQREHSNMADRYLFSSDQIQLWFNRFFLYPNTKNKTKRKQRKSCAIICTDIHLQALCKLYFKNNTIKESYLNLNQRHYNGYLRLNNARANKRKVFIPIQLVNKRQTRNIEQTT